MAVEGPRLAEIRDRLQMIRYFDGYADERMSELDKHDLKKPLVKTHLLENQCDSGVTDNGAIRAPWLRYGVTLTQLDDSLYLVVDRTGEEIGFLEQLRPRIAALYSTLKSDEIGRWVRDLVLSTASIDHVWLSGLTFNVLWKLIAKSSQRGRFTKLVFTHDSIFDVDRWDSDADDEGGSAPHSFERGFDRIVDRRATSLRIVDRVGVIDDKLAKLQDVYSPLFAISQLRFPSTVGRGGHDFYDNGRATNRCSSFTDHRSHLMLVVQLYERLLSLTEEYAWFSTGRQVSMRGAERTVGGAPVVVRFREALTPAVFDRWVTSTFVHKRNRFRLWGEPIRLGPCKVHIYGVDRHLWQPLFLELTERSCIAILPQGTCGNTVHRLVTNIQRFVDPGATAFIGDRSYDDVVNESATSDAARPPSLRAGR
jgi:hypothetical protein